MNFRPAIPDFGSVFNEYVHGRIGVWGGGMVWSCGIGKAEIIANSAKLGLDPELILTKTPCQQKLLTIL